MPETDMDKKDIEELNEDKLPKSNDILERAKKVLLSPMSTGPFRPPKAVAFIKDAKGSKIVDEDDNEYVDMTMGYGICILGHGHPVVTAAIQNACTNGTVYDIAHQKEVRMAEIMVDAIPCAERVAFCNSGTEATMHAMRIARAGSGKDKIAKFEGGYHGVHDYALVSGMLSMPAGPIEDPESVPDNHGIPQGTVDNVITLSFNTPDSLDKIRQHKDELAAVIIEPVPSCFTVDMKEFLQQLRAVTKECNVLLIFDEVLTGFRLGYGGGQAYFDIVPDMATYGKIIGGGLPVGAIAGSVEVMNPLIPTGDPWVDFEEKLSIIGTCSGNPLTMTAGIATLEYLRDNPQVYDHMNTMAERIKNDVNRFSDDNEYGLKLIGVGSWFVPHFVQGWPETPRDLRELDSILKQEILCQYLRYNGVYLPDLHTGFVSAAHTDDDADKIIEAFKTSLTEMSKEELLD